MSHFVIGSKNTWKNKSVLITGGTGSFGKACVRFLLDHYQLARIIIFSRDELKQHEMMASGFKSDNLRFFIGDIRDKERLMRAMNGVDIVIHAAALKQVPSCEYNPMEAILTNIVGTRNVIEAALDNDVEKVLALSTDKAVNPVNLYGATKLCAEKLIVQSNSYSGVTGTKFSCVRYGNVVGSRGSVIPIFLEQRNKGTLTVTDERMTRFWITLDQGVSFVLRSIEDMKGGEIYVPKIPSMRVMDLAKTIAPQSKLHFSGIRPGEKLHESLLAEDEARSAMEHTDMYVIYPHHPWWTNQKVVGKKVPAEFTYISNVNEKWLSGEDLAVLVNEYLQTTKKNDPTSDFPVEISA